MIFETRKSNLVIWAIAAWMTPPVVAGAMGWSGIWGGGSAFADYLIPIPVAGGALHVPSFALALFIVVLYSQLSTKPAIVLRAACLGCALFGFVQLIDVERVYLSLTTDLSLTRIPWEKNPFGLFVLSDALWTLLWMIRWPRLTTHAAAATAIAIGIPALYVFNTINTSERLNEPFMAGMSVTGPERGDESQFMYTTLSVTDPEFQASARAAVDQWLAPPEANAVVEDMAVYFTDSLDAARRYELDRVLVTLCLYEDGTPDLWLEGQGDCFSDHVTFTERMSGAFANQSARIPRDVHLYLAVLAACDGVELPEERDRRYLAEYSCYDLGADLERLREKYPDGEISELLSGAP